MPSAMVLVGGESADIDGVAGGGIATRATMDLLCASSLEVVVRNRMSRVVNAPDQVQAGAIGSASSDGAWSRFKGQASRICRGRGSDICRSCYEGISVQTWRVIDLGFQANGATYIV